MIITTIAWISVYSILFLTNQKELIIHFSKCCKKTNRLVHQFRFLKNVYPPIRLENKKNHSSSNQENKVDTQSGEYYFPKKIKTSALRMYGCILVLQKMAPRTFKQTFIDVPVCSDCVLFYNFMILKTPLLLITRSFLGVIES